MAEKPWAIVTGGAGTLGSAIAERLRESHRVVVWDKEPNTNFTCDQYCSVNIASGGEILEAVDNLPKDCHHIDVLVNCAGINELAWLDHLSMDAFWRHMAVNAGGIVNTVKVLTSKLSYVPRNYNGGTICNIVSNASHVPMRASLAYNASKAAAAMITKQMARELFDRHGITVFAVSPNQLDGTSGMTKQVVEQVRQLRGDNEAERMVHGAGTAIGKPTPPARVAEFVAWLLADRERHMYLHGCDIPYGA